MDSANQGQSVRPVKYSKEFHISENTTGIREMEMMHDILLEIENLIQPNLDIIKVLAKIEEGKRLYEEWREM